MSKRLNEVWPFGSNKRRQSAQKRNYGPVTHIGAQREAEVGEPPKGVEAILQRYAARKAESEAPPAAEGIPAGIEDEVTTAIAATTATEDPAAEPPVGKASLSKSPHEWVQQLGRMTVAKKLFGKTVLSPDDINKQKEKGEELRRQADKVTPTNDTHISTTDLVKLISPFFSTDPGRVRPADIKKFANVLAGKKIMKETKKLQLKKIIKEELTKFLLEQKNPKSMFTVTNESNNDLSSIEEHLNDFLDYSRGKLEFTNPVSVKFISDSENAQDTLGKTAFYDPAMNEISLYVDNRHPKDVMRSLSHELVHHAQNCRGDFANQSPIGEQGYAQKDDHLREMEREAYETGNMVFRDWEDGVRAAAGGEQQVSLEEWKRDQINNRLMERFGFTAPEEDISAFRCIISERKTLKTIKEGEEMMTLKDAFEKIRNHPESDRLLALPIQAAIAEIEAVEQATAGFEGEVEARPELAIAPPGMTKRGTELAMRTDWSRKAKPSSEVPEDLGAVDVPIPSEEEIETVAGAEELTAEIPVEDEEEENVREWYLSSLNKRLMEGLKRG